MGREGVREGVADVFLSFSVVTLVLFCFAFVFLLSSKPRSFVQSFFGMFAPRQPHAVS